MKHIWRQITQLWSHARTAVRALRRNRRTLSKAFVTGVAYQTGVIVVALIYWWWTTRR
jgi:hypothetical protein